VDIYSKRNPPKPPLYSQKTGKGTVKQDKNFQITYLPNANITEKLVAPLSSIPAKTE
jgi:hypothetical protein